MIAAAPGAATVVTADAAGRTPVRILAAGSLRGVIADVAAAWASGGGGRIDACYGASGLLRERIAGGEAADVFASANMEHPRSLAAAGRAGPVSMFARNTLCALSTRAANVTTDTLLDRMLDPAIKLGTSTPKADPSGDYAFALFEKAERFRPGAYATLATKALKLTGGPEAPPRPPGPNVYGALVAGGHADIFLTYYTTALAARSAEPSLVISRLPEALSVAADYGVTVVDGASVAARCFVELLLSEPGGRIIAAHGFMLPSRTQEIPR